MDFAQGDALRGLDPAAVDVETPFRGLVRVATRRSSDRKRRPLALRDILRRAI